MPDSAAWARRQDRIRQRRYRKRRLIEARKSNRCTVCERFLASDNATTTCSPCKMN